jgi:hypothetical protein
MSDHEIVKPGGSDLRLAVGGRASEAESVVDGKPEPAASELVDMATEATWEEALCRLGKVPSNPLPLWMLLASRILRAVADGERDPQRLKRLALDGLNDHDWLGT